MELAQELERIAEIAQSLASDGEQVTGVVPAEPDAGVRVYLCSFEHGERRSWLALDAAGRPVADRALVRDAASIAAMCELADESAGGGDLSELRAQLVSLRLTESPPGIDEAEEAALALEATVGTPPRVASPAHLDAVGAATLRLERALGEGASPFAESMKHALGAVEELQAEIVGGYRVALEG